MDPQKGTPSVKGEYGNTFADGSSIGVSFTANENGFLPKVRFQISQLNTKDVPELENRIPSAAIGTLAGGGIG